MSIVFKIDHTCLAVTVEKTPSGSLVFAMKQKLKEICGSHVILHSRKQNKKKELTEVYLFF